MSFSVKRINKYFRWYKKHNRNFVEDCNESVRYAKICSDLDWALLLKRPDSVVDRLSETKHQYILERMESICCDTIQKYQGITPPRNLNIPNTETKVWSMWWQGEENADELFRMCINSARMHTGSEVITLGEKNYRNYFEIPEIMLRKRSEGKIALQHICDYMVMAIMAAEGGFFTGATVWWSQDKGDEILRAPFFICKAETKRKILISRSRWVGYVMGGNKEFPLWSFVRDCLEEYWSKCDRAIDYLMMDYLFELAYRTIPCVKQIIDDNCDNNLLRNELINHLGDEFNPEEFRRYTEGDTFLYKLSWKFGEKPVTTDSGRKTVYAHMLEEFNHCVDK